jgi:hypothetical protein
LRLDLRAASRPFVVRGCLYAWRVIQWVLTAARPFAWLTSKGRRLVCRWARNKQQLVEETADVVSETREFVHHATPLSVSIERRSHPGEIEARLETFEQEWRALRPRLIKAADRHPSDDVQRLGNELAEDVEKLLMGLRFLASQLTDPSNKAAASKSVMERREHAAGLADNLLQKVRSYSP